LVLRFDQMVELEHGQARAGQRSAPRPATCRSGGEITHQGRPALILRIGEPRFRRAGFGRRVETDFCADRVAPEFSDEIPSSLFSNRTWQPVCSRSGGFQPPAQVISAAGKSPLTFLLNANE